MRNTFYIGPPANTCMCTYAHVHVHKRVYISIYKTEMYPQITLLISNAVLHFFNGKKKKLFVTSKKKKTTTCLKYTVLTQLFLKQKERGKERKKNKGRKEEK